MKVVLFDLFRSLLTIISPKLNAIVTHYIKTGKKIDFDNPKSFSEKIVSLKIKEYNNSPLVRICADKFLVRSYIEQKGCGKILNDLIATYENVNDIDWNMLPQQFAMKWNFGCGYNIICSNKDKLNYDKVKKQMRRWQKSHYYLKYAELQYKNVEKKIIVEKYLLSKDGHLPTDYKLYCFNGKCMAILYISERDQKRHKAAFFDNQWNYLGVPVKENGTIKYDNVDMLPPAPKSLNEMIETAEVLSRDFPFVRIDYYDVDGKAIFGEMTFTPAGGHDVSQININGKNMSEFLVYK